jgi:hypothetical protein
MLESSGRRPLDLEHGGKRAKARMHAQEECKYEGLECAVIGVINAWYSSLGGISRGSIYRGG